MPNTSAASQRADMGARYMAMRAKMLAASLCTSLLGPSPTAPPFPTEARRSALSNRPHPLVPGPTVIHLTAYSSSPSPTVLPPLWPPSAPPAAHLEP
ncbi:hypothetical protein DFH08DRAFT_978880 [Mycena albidolilacea]|uniref:Uncharacterized protein n=1 Tax=Mycena albidolilacea TaxID=1033008 RepID=A0AAD6YXV3_9AGAR|nr:hypothetical protein DFH08DRAFT_978880 [Mycena albidolilacea]